jgi:hypothetical protein
MIIRRATLVVAGTRCQGAQCHERPILPQPGWDEALQAVCLVRLLAKGAPQSVARGALGSRDRAAAGMPRPHCWGARHSASGSHLPVEDTAPPCAVATRSAGRGTREAGSTRVGDATTALMDDRAAHPIPQSRVAPAEICSAVP